MASIDHRDDVLWLASEGSLVIAVWRGPPRAGQIDRLTKYSRERSALVGPCGLLNVVTGGMPRLGDSMREEGARSLAGGTVGVGIAHVVLLDGIAGAAVRAVLGTMRLTSRSNEPIATFRSLSEGARWLAPRLSAHEPWTAEQIERAYRSVVG